MESTILVPVPETTPFVHEDHLRHDPSAAAGIPEHITLLYPFLSPERLDGAIVERLGTILTAVSPFPFILRRFQRFDQGVLYLAPEPARRFVDLTGRLVDAFGVLPFEGRFPEVVPHLTVTQTADEQTMESISSRITPILPIQAVAREALLMVGSNDTAWTVRERFPFEGDEEGWYEGIRELLEGPYLAADNPRGQSGFGGDAERWERARRVIAEVVDRDGSFLDVGCASGLLMETMVAWARARGHRLEPYGLDLSPRLAELARSRLPHWSGRIFEGNIMRWEPPRRFDFVRTELVYVPERRRRDLVARLLERVVAPGGRLIVCSYGSSRRPAPRTEPIADMLQDWGFEVAGAAHADVNGVVVTRVAWVDAAP